MKPPLWLTLLVDLLLALTLFGGGFAAAWSWQGSRGDARVSAVEAGHAQEKIRQDAAWRKDIERRQARADAIDRAAAERDRTLNAKLKETQHALTTATLGRPCLGGAALRLLDQSTGLRPPTPAELAGTLYGGSAAAAADSESAGDEVFATDSGVSEWIAVAGDYYERCRARIRDIRQYESGE